MTTAPKTTTIHLTDRDAFLVAGDEVWRLPFDLPTGGIALASKLAWTGNPPAEGAERVELPAAAQLAIMFSNDNVLARGAIPITFDHVYRFVGWSTKTMLATRAEVAELVSCNQIAVLTGVNYQRAHSWMSARSAPEPVSPDSKHPQWRWADVRAYLMGPAAPLSKLVERWRAEERQRELEALESGS